MEENKINKEDTDLIKDEQAKELEGNQKSDQSTEAFVKAIRKLLNHDDPGR